MSGPTVRERIIAALRGTGRPMTANALARRIGYEKTCATVVRTLEAMVEDGCVENCNGCAHCGAGRKYALAKGE